MSDTADRQELARTVRAVLAKHGDRSVLRRAIDSDLGYDEHLWKLLCEQVGVAALAIPEQYGGIGAGLPEAFVVLEELGRTLHAPPMLGSAVLGTQAILLSGDTAACERLLPEVAEGTRTLALCWADEHGWETPGVHAEGDRLTGTAHYVLDGAAADTLVVVTSAGLYEIDAAARGVTRSAVPTMDPSRRLSVITFTDAPARLLGVDPGQKHAGNDGGHAGNNGGHDGNNGDVVENDGVGLRGVVVRLRDIAWAAVAAEQVGAAEECLWMTVEYTKSRVQFGRPIGSFQALKHRMADMYVLVESARSAAYRAAAALDESGGNTSTALDLAAARRHCSEAFAAVAGETVQLHGGIAITWEHDAHLYFKRAHGDTQLFGMPHRPLARPA